MASLENREKLKLLMSDHNLTCREVGELVGRSTKTVLVWRDRGDKDIPDTVLELLTLKLQARGK